MIGERGWPQSGAEKENYPREDGPMGSPRGGWVVIGGSCSLGNGVAWTVWKEKEKVR